ncbi:MAG: GNAT family N-acetyltransferase, partial [Pseudomonadota bacterium]
ESISVHPLASRNGIGRTLVTIAETHARSLDCATLSLYTGAVLKQLVSWYKRCGFEVVGEDIVEERPIVNMQKRIEPA